MNPTFQRAMILFDQGRHADAEREFRSSLASDPGQAMAHSMLALTLVASRGAERMTPRLDEAQREAEQAVGLAPDEPFTHYARARVLLERNRLTEAEASASEALQLDASRPEYYWLLGVIRFQQEHWTDALGAADEGLALDPEHDGCANLRAMALVRLGRRHEAGAAIGQALARDPDNATTHANQGWTLLHKGEHKKALEHFREALRIDPELDWARVGMVEALKARHLVYRLMLGYFLWMSRLGSRTQWAIVLGGWFGYQILRDAAAKNPSLKPIVWPILIAYVLFVVLSWLADPLFNLLLRLSKFGRMVLLRKQVIASNVIGGLLLGAGISLAGAFVFVSPPLLMLAFVLGVMTLPVSGAFRVPAGWPQTVMAVACSVLALLGLGAVTLRFFDHISPTSPDSYSDLSWTLMRYFGWGVLIASIGCNYLRSARPTR